jgi:hypothetical protein
MIQSRDFDEAQLERFRACQQRAYRTLEQVAQTIEIGESEAAVARRLRHAFAQQGVRSYFHVPVALFGARTAYPGGFGQLAALPTAHRLAEGEAVILDAAPVFEDITADVSLAVPRRGSEQPFARADALLRDLRALILERTRERKASMREIACEVDAVISERGFENCHRKHIGKVLAHRITRTESRWLAGQRVFGLSPAPVLWFFWNSYRSSCSDPTRTPNWNHTRQCDCPVQPGLWAVEPHVGLGAVGAKFEEILVVGERDAHYLDDDLPHLRRWAAAGSLALSA